MSEAYHPVVGFMNEFTSILISGAGSNAAIAIAFPTALGVLMPMSDVTIKAIAIIAIVFLSAVNYFGVKGGTLVQNIFTVAKVIPIILIIVLGISQGNQTVNLSLTISSGENFFDIVSMIALAVMTTMWTYVLIEADGVPYEIAKEALRLAAQKLPITTKFIVRRDYDANQNA